MRQKVDKQALKLVVGLVWNSLSEKNHVIKFHSNLVFCKALSQVFL